MNNLEPWLADNVRRAVRLARYSIFFLVAMNIWSFAVKFTFTRMVWKGIGNAGFFGIVLSAIATPFAIGVDLIILIGGLSIGMILFFMIVVTMPILILSMFFRG